MIVTSRQRDGSPAHYRRFSNRILIVLRLSSSAARARRSTIDRRRALNLPFNACARERFA